MPVRRLTAILAADVAGYSRLMGADEEGTHERLQAHFRELISPKINEHRGRIVKNTGDGLLAEFQSVVDAVCCAVEVQREMVERSADTPPEERIEFRIGINLGDVIAEEHDIFGDGVNGDEAKAELAEALRLKPNLNSLAAWRAERPWEATPQMAALPKRIFIRGCAALVFPMSSDAGFVNPATGAFRIRRGALLRIPHNSAVMSGCGRLHGITVIRVNDPLSTHCCRSRANRG
jgi:hypothetical protein